MIESPWLKEIVEEQDAKSRRQDIEEVLSARFGTVPAEVKAGLQSVTDPSRLLELVRWAARCPDLDAFRARLSTAPT